MTSFDRRSFLALGGVFALGGLSACRAEPATADPPTSRSVITRPPATSSATHDRLRSVAMVGDSLTEASVRVLTASLTAVGFTDIHIEGKKNRRIEVGNGFGEAPPSGLLTIAAMQKAGVSPDVWVIELGTNDLGGYKDAQGFGDIVDKAMALIPPTLPLVWVNTFRTDYPDRAKLFNLVLQGRIGSRRRSLVADWYSIASAPDQTVLRDDGVHPNAAGVQALSVLVVQALQRL